MKDQKAGRFEKILKLFSCQERNNKIQLNLNKLRQQLNKKARVDCNSNNTRGFADEKFEI